MTRECLIHNYLERKAHIGGILCYTEDEITIRQVQKITLRTDDVFCLWNSSSLKLSYRDNMYLQLDCSILEPLLINGTDRLMYCTRISLPYRNKLNGEVYIELFNDTIPRGRLNVIAKAVYRENARGYMKRQLLRG